jgi:hypothetical protein
MTSICSTIAFLALTSIASAADYDGYWRQATPDRTQSRACKVVRNEEEMSQALKTLKWDFKATTLSVNWSRSAAVIIAPQSFYRGYTLSFIGLTGSEVRWGFLLPAVQVRTTTSETIGGGKEGLETIVIAFPKGLASSITCPENRKQP